MNLLPKSDDDIDDTGVA